MIYDILICGMPLMAVVVFVALFYFKAGYGYLSGGKWGPQISNKVAWVCMEAPAFLMMAAMVGFSIVSHNPKGNAATYVIAGLYLLHYFQRSFIFPLLMRGHSKMPVTIMMMGVLFNTINAWLLGEWLFERSGNLYSNPSAWLTSPQFIIGLVVFFTGMFINMQSDYIIRHLRKPGDTKHYIPRKGMYKYVTSANYLGELVEWIGYAILSWSPAAVIFVIWTFANLAPRSKTLSEKYVAEFGQEYTSLHKKNLIPFIW